MAQAISNAAATLSLAEANTNVARPGYQAYQILRLGFTVAPIVAGLDKFSISSSIGINTFPRSSTI